MNSVVFLSEEDFSIQPAKKGGYVLCNNIPGVSLVLFFSQQCPHCSDVYPHFSTLPRIIPGCRFALLNISNNVGVAHMSNKTIAPITHVPFIILYVNGRPAMKYNGEKSLRGISNFVNEVMSRLQVKKSFTSTSKVDSLTDEIPEYASGIPFNLVCEGEQCYLTFSEAYNKK